MIGWLVVLVAAGDVDLSARARIGVEHDTNARRAVPALESEAVPSIGRPLAVVPDQALSGRLELGARWSAPEGRGAARLLLGSKRFIEEAEQDQVVLEGQLHHEWRLDRWRLSAFGSARTSRMRGGQRDYDLATGGLDVGFVARALSARVRGWLTAFEFAPEPRFDHWGPTLELEAGWRPLAGVDLSVRGARQDRIYGGNALVVGALEDGEGGTVPVLTFCDRPVTGLRCRSAPRRDEEWRAGLTLRYQADWLGELSYGFRAQRSSSPVEDVDRHRVVALLSVPLPWSMIGTARGALQYNDGRSVADTLQLTEDDENLNVLQLQLERPLGGSVDLQVRYALYASSFGGRAIDYRRQTVSIGAQVRAGP